MIRSHLSAPSRAVRTGRYPERSSAKRKLSLGVVAALLLAVAPVSAFPHVAKSGETLAGLAKRFYGRVQMERVIATANSMDQRGPSGIVPGMILEIPAITYRQVGPGETWKSLGSELLGSEARHVLLAEMNGHKPWVEPELGQLIAVPYNLAWIASGEDSLATLAYRFLGSTKHAYRLVQYNSLGEGELTRGDILLLPLSELPLTAEGRAAAARAAAQITQQSHGDHFEAQQESKSETKLLAEDVRGGRYVSAVARGTALAASASLTRPDRIEVQQLLLESYVALDARGLARTACDRLQELDPGIILDPLTTSPKILRVCPLEKARAEKAPAPEEEKGVDSEEESTDP